MDNLDQKFREAKDAYVSGDFAKAKLGFDFLIDQHPSSKQALLSRYLRGRAFEDGVFGAVDLNKALADFLALDEIADVYGSDGTLGVARVLYQTDKISQAERVVSLCKKAVDRDANVKAMMLLGLVHETSLSDPKSALRWYLSAYRKGLPWGLRYYAQLQRRRGKVFLSTLAHLAATVTSPFLVLRYGVRSALK